MDRIEGHEHRERERKVLAEEGIGCEARCKPVTLGCVPDDLVEVRKVEGSALECQPASRGVCEVDGGSAGGEGGRRNRQRPGQGATSDRDRCDGAQDDTITRTLCRPVDPAGAKPLDVGV